MAYDDFYKTDATKAGNDDELGSSNNISNLGKMSSLTDYNDGYEKLFDLWYISVFTLVYTIIVGILIPPFGLYLLYNHFRNVKARD